MLIILIISICILLVFAGFMIYIKHQMSKIPELSFEEALEYTTQNNADAVITVGVIKDGEISYKVYGENKKELSPKKYTYEIGSLTKTFTAMLINKAINDDKIDIDSTIDKYLPLSEKNNHPTIKQLLTHTSGYKSWYFARPMISNFFKRRNDFYGITKEMVLSKANKLNCKNSSYPFKYSNYGYAVLGLVLESVYNTDFKKLMNDFIHDELGLKDTYIFDKNKDLQKSWDWKETDAYLSAGAITSNITDMLKYAQIMLLGNECIKCLKKINALSKSHKMMDINMDKIGMAWLIDEKNSVVWHNGGTGNYNSYLGFNPEQKIAVVILSNLPPSYRIPATVLGIKLLKKYLTVHKTYLYDLKR